MFAIKRNQVIITALVVMIAVAGYLNYIDTTTPNDSTNITYNDELDGIGSLVIDDATGQEVMIVNSNKSLETAINPVEGEIGIALTFDEARESLNAVTLSDLTQGVPTGSSTDSIVENNEESGAAVFVNNSNDSSFFVQAKLDREQSRAKQKETLTELINNQNMRKHKKLIVQILCLKSNRE